MPSSPELCYGLGNVGIVEVLQVIEAEDLAEADGHIGISAEIEVDLESESQSSDPGKRCSRMASHVHHGVDLFPDDCHLVGDEDLFGKAHDEASDACSDPALVGNSVLKLDLHVGVSDDGACDELREQRYVCSQGYDVLLALDLASKYVNYVGHGLEGIEADADGKSHADQAQTCSCKAVHGLDDEVRILEKTQKS